MQHLKSGHSFRNNKMERERTSASWIGFFGLLAIVFIALKLTGHINWSWWLVLGPLWMPPVAILAICGVVFGVALFMAWITDQL